MMNRFICLAFRRIFVPFERPARSAASHWTPPLASCARDARPTVTAASNARRFTGIDRRTAIGRSASESRNSRNSWRIFRRRNSQARLYKRYYTSVNDYCTSLLLFVEYLVTLLSQFFQGRLFCLVEKNQISLGKRKSARDEKFER